MVKIQKFLKFWLPPILWAILIFMLSSGSLPNITDTYWGDFTFKKFSHVIFYGVLGVLLYRALVSEGLRKQKAFYLAVIISMLYGMSDEVHQFFVPGRTSDVRDVFFDTTGAMLSVLGFKKILERFPKWEEKFL